MSEMRILTVRQPWAWAIIHGGKDVENRSRNIAGGYRGPVAIHAALREDTSARQHPEIQRLARDVWWTTPDDLLTGRRDQYGRIIGVVDLVDVHRAADHELQDYDPTCGSPWAESDGYHLVLANPRPLLEPIPYRGAPGLPELDDATIQRVLEQVPHDEHDVERDGPVEVGSHELGEHVDDELGVSCAEGGADAIPNRSHAHHVRGGRAPVIRRPS